MLEHKNQYSYLFELSLNKRPEEELYDIGNDPGCMNNLAGKKEFRIIQKELRDNLKRYLKEQKDPRVMGNGDIFESYPRYSRMRKFTGFKEKGE